MLNTIAVQGRLTAKPELRYTNSQTAVVSFSLACQRDFGENKTDFFRVEAWSKTAEFISRYFDKGDMIVIQGRFQTDEWQDSEGNKRSTTKIVAERANFCGSKKDSESDGSSAAQPVFADVDDDSDDLPF